MVKALIQHTKMSTLDTSIEASNNSLDQIRKAQDNHESDFHCKEEIIAIIEDDNFDLKVESTYRQQ